jgi:SAM-dependent methyltransferase
MFPEVSYETYDQTHLHYDKTRLAIGNEQLIGLLGAVNRSSLRVLDAGCGTGLHLSAFDKAGFRNLTGLDASITGLAQTAQKLRTQLICGDIRHMPFAPESFDLVLFSFVLHHLPQDGELSVKQVLSAAVKLLTPGGRIAIITCVPGQISPETGCMWYYKYFPEAAAKLSARFLRAPILESIMRACGLVYVQSQLMNRTYWTAANLDQYGPFNSDWRSGDSFFAICSEDPTLFAHQLAILKQDIISGKAQECIAEARKRTESIKQAIILLGTKSRN